VGPGRLRDRHGTEGRRKPRLFFKRPRTHPPQRKEGRALPPPARDEPSSIPGRRTRLHEKSNDQDGAGKDSEKWKEGGRPLTRPLRTPGRKSTNQSKVLTSSFDLPGIEAGFPILAIPIKVSSLLQAPPISSPLEERNGKESAGRQPSEHKSGQGGIRSLRLPLPNCESFLSV